MAGRTLLPDLDLERFTQNLRPFLSHDPLPPPAILAMYKHYRELRAWAPRLALIGPGTFDEVLHRHFGESLAALPLIPRQPARSGNLVDVGSGAGFPGLVLAAARPAWAVTLVEPRQKKWAFLMAVCRKAGLSCHCLNARVDDPLPEGIPESIDVVTARAIRLPPTELGLLLERLSPAGKALLWVGDDEPDLPPGFRATTAVHLLGSDRRRIIRVERQPDETEPPTSRRV